MKTVVITGGTSGIGFAAAKELASRGHRLILIGQNPDRGRQAMARLATAAGQKHRLMLANLTMMADARRVIDDLMSSEDVIDVLANNAGTWFRHRKLTGEGLERTVALNHLAYVALTLGLKDMLLRAPDPRIINTGSFVYRHARYDPANFQSEKRFSTNATYAATKLYNLMFTRALAQRWSDSPIRINCFNPGFVATNFGRGEGGILEPYYRFVRLFAKTPERGAETLVYLADSDQVSGVTGAYFSDCRAKPVARIAVDEQANDALLRWSAATCGFAI